MPTRGLMVNLTVNVFQDGNQWVAYNPSLDLSTCGDTIKEAQRNFAEAVNLFLEECRRKGTLEVVLKSCGWVRTARPTPHYEPPQSYMTTQSVSVPVHA